MSGIKTKEQIEFADLFAQLKKHDASVKAKDIAAIVDLTASQVSQILSGKRSTSALRVAALRRHVTQLCGGETSPSEENEVEFWKRKANDAERELDAFKRQVRKLTEPVSSDPSSDKPAIDSGKLSKAAEEAVTRHFSRRRAGEPIS